MTGLILTNNKVSNILSMNINILSLKLSTITNRNLMDSFRKNFLILDNYKPEHNSVEDWHIKDFSKAYINEFRQRLKSSDLQGLYEFADLMKLEMEKEKDKQVTYFSRNLLRLYSYTVKLLKSKLSKKQLKKDFL